MESNKEKKPFSVTTYSLVNKDSGYEHWSEGLKMVIIKNGVTIKLEKEEIEELVKALPRARCSIR